LETTAVQHLPADADPEIVGEIVREDGASRVDGVVFAELLDSIEAEARPYIQATPLGPDDFARVLAHTGSLIARSPSVRQLVMHQLALRRPARSRPVPLVLARNVATEARATPSSQVR
jgi:hypothetical protein